MPLSGVDVASKRHGEHDLLATARELAARFREGAAERDAERRFPLEQLTELRRSGLLALLVPAGLGGRELPLSAHLRIVGELASGDPNVAQMYHGHGVAVRIVDQLPDAATRAELHERVARGEVFWANAYSEITTKNALSFAVTANRVAEGWRLSGSKFYCTGSHGSDELFVSAIEAGSPGDPEPLLLFVPTDAVGVELHDDWHAMGQRTTSSGTVTFEDVLVADERVMSHQAVYDSATSPRSLLTQSGFTAVYLGIARDALSDALQYVRERARPYPYSGVETAAEDPYLLYHLGRAVCELDAASAVHELALELVDRADMERAVDARGDAAVAVAKAKALASESVLEVTQRMFQICGAGSTLGGNRFDRHWRNARTLTLHDPVDYKYRLVGEHAVTGRYPEVTPYT